MTHRKNLERCFFSVIRLESESSSESIFTIKLNYQIVIVEENNTNRLRDYVIDFYFVKDVNIPEILKQNIEMIMFKLVKEEIT